MARDGVDIAQVLDDLAPQRRLLNNGGNILNLYARIEELLGKNDQDWTLFAKTVTSSPLQLDLLLEAALLYLAFEGCIDLLQS